MAKQTQPKLYVEVDQIETRSTCCFSFRIRDENAAEGEDVVFDRWAPPKPVSDEQGESYDDAGELILEVAAIEFDPACHHRLTCPSRHAADRAGRRFIRRHERSGDFTTAIGVTAGGK